MNTLPDLAVAAAAGVAAGAYKGFGTSEPDIIFIGSAAAVGLGLALILDEEGVWDGSPTWNPSYTAMAALGLALVGGYVVYSMS